MERTRGTVATPVKRVRGNSSKHTATQKPKEKEIPEEYRGLQKWGGHMPHPPEQCPATRFMTDTDGTKWVNMVFCPTICGGKSLNPLKYCPERKKYSKFLRGEY